MMNRLWVRLALVIATIVLFVALLPVAAHKVAPPDYGSATTPCHREKHLAVDRTWQWVSRTLLVGGGLGLLASVLLSRWLVSPLSRIEQGTRAVTERRLDYRVPEVGSQEMRSVARGFNQMAHELERQETLRRNLLADVTHELRHPVHVLQGSLQAVLDDVYPLNKEEIALMLEQTQHLATLVEDLHALARAEAKELPLHLQRIELGELVQETADGMMPLADEKEIALQVSRPPQPLFLAVDPLRLRQLLHNLLSNALRYTPHRGRIDILLARAGDHVTLTVKDSGIGISAAELPYLFDRFYRGDVSRDRAAGGAGLGLAIAKAIAEAHGGWITAESSGPNRGSSFTLYLPGESAPGAARGEAPSLRWAAAQG